MNKNFRVFVDFDGVLAEFKNVGPDVYSAPGYSRLLRPNLNLVWALRMLHDAGVEIYLCSAVLPLPHTVEDKNYWLDRHMPWLDMDHRIYVEYGVSKKGAIEKVIGKDGIKKGDIFLDDYTKNLYDFEGSDMTPIKVLNRINDTNGSWHGARVSILSSKDSLCAQIAGLSMAVSDEAFLNVA